MDARRPLSPRGLAAAERLAAEAAARTVRPAVVWHSGKLRAKQTAEVFWRACNALAEFAATRDLQPADPPMRMRERLRHEARDVLLVGHFPHLPQLRALLLAEPPQKTGTFPVHGMVTLVTDDEGDTWTEAWRMESA